MIKIIDATFKYGDFTAVKKLNLRVKSGEIYGFLGANGSGKTTTFRAIMGLLEPHSGKVLYNDKKVTYQDVNDFGYMIEERSLLKKMTTRELILYFGQLKDLDINTIIKRLDYWLEFFDIVDYKDKKTQELSKGNQQKVQFIASIINEPKVLVLDEPFSGLDPINTDLFIKAIKYFQEKGSAIIFSSHQLDHVESFCEYITVIEKGEVIIEGEIKQIKKSFGKQNIEIVGDVNLENLKNINGVEEVVKHANYINVLITNDSYINDVFKYISKYDNITKFEVKDARLSEIFIQKVGEKRAQI